MPTITEEFDNIKKTKRNKHITECNVKRRSSRNCGICGSENTADQGVYYCSNCDKEEEYLVLAPSWQYSGDKNNVCNCIYVKVFGIRRYVSDYIASYGVGKCLDCGAVRSRYCPNCKDSGKCWQSSFGERYCTKCGFRFKGHKI
jgi:hypothetical protein